MGTWPGHEDLGTFRQYLKLREEVHIRECDGMRRDLRVELSGITNISGMGRILEVN